LSNSTASAQIPSHPPNPTDEAIKKTTTQEATATSEEDEEDVIYFQVENKYSQVRVLKSGSADYSCSNNSCNKIQQQDDDYEQQQAPSHDKLKVDDKKNFILKPTVVCKQFYQ
jgi:hypothetical protein